MQPARATATWTSRLAHAWRNDLGVLLAGADMVDDEQLAADMRDSARTLQRSLERLVCISRVELEMPSADVELAAADLVRAGATRARREGAAVAACTSAGDDTTRVTTSGVLAERLVADVVHQLAIDAPGAIVVDVQPIGEHEVQLTFVPQSSVTVRETNESDMVAATCDLIAGAIGARVAVGATEGSLAVRMRVCASSVG